MSDKTVRVDKDGKVTTITIDRAHCRNALDDATLHALRAAFAAAADDADTSIVILTGDGGESFCAGTDIKELAGQSIPERVAHTDLGQQLADEIEASPCAVIAAIDGYCLGGGFELALACDLMVVGEGSELGLPEVSISALPGWGSTYRLPRAVGLSRAKQIMLFDRRLTAAEAVEWGLAGEAVAAGGALAKAIELGTALAETDRETVTRGKRLIDAFGVDGPTARRLEYLTDSVQLASSAFDSSFNSFGK